MAEDYTRLLVDEGDIRSALERFRQAERLGDNGLSHLVLVRQRIGTEGPGIHDVQLEIAISDLLHAIITEQTSTLRNAQGIETIPDQNRAQVEQVIRRDFACANAELEAWSLLYYRYVRLDLNLQVQDLALILGISDRQIRRRMAHGFFRLTFEISRLEQGMRQRHRRLWLELRLPSLSYGQLFGIDSARLSLEEALQAGFSQPIVVCGAGGSGKSTLVHAVLRQAISVNRLEDLAWVTLSNPTSYGMLVGRLAHVLGYMHFEFEQLTHIEHTLRMHLSERLTAVVVDNADYLEGYPDPLPRLAQLARPGWLLATARQVPSRPQAIYQVPLSPLAHTDFRELLLYHVRLRRLPLRKLVEERIDALYKTAGGNPLAGQMLLTHLAALPAERATKRLYELTDSGESILQALYQKGWDELSGVAQRTAIILQAFPGNLASYGDLQQVSSMLASQLDHGIEELARSSWIDVVEGPRYRLQPLARQFIAAQIQDAPLHAAYLTALERWLKQPAEDYQADAIGQSLIILGQQMTSGLLHDDPAALIIELAPLARRSGQWLVWSVFLERLLALRELHKTSRHEAARILLELGVALRWLGAHGQAAQRLSQAAEGFGAVGDFVGQAEALVELGQVYTIAQQSQHAYTAYQRAASVAMRYDVQALRRRALEGLAEVMLAMSRPEGALDFLQQAYTLLDEDSQQGTLLSLMGVTLLQLDRAGEAVKMHRQALDALREEGNLPREARARLRLAAAYEAYGNVPAALDELRNALSLMRALGDILGTARGLNNLGAIFARSEMLLEAQQAWTEALNLQQRLGDQVGMAHTLYNLADLAYHLERPEEARQNIQQASLLAEELGLDRLQAHIHDHPILRRGTT